MIASETSNADPSMKNRTGKAGFKMAAHTINAPASY
jgi:hypothetical protein